MVKSETRRDAETLFKIRDREITFFQIRVRDAAIQKSEPETKTRDYQC